jgi:hypothetical protein
MADKPIHGLVSIPRSGAISRRVWKTTAAPPATLPRSEGGISGGGLSRLIVDFFLTLPQICFSKEKLATQETV